MTADTEIPAVVPKEARKVNPNMKEFEKTMMALDAKIEDIKNKMVREH